MTTYIPPKKGAEYIFYAGLVSQSTGQFQENPTIAAGDFKVSIDGGALNNLATLPAVTPATSRMVKFTLSTSEMNGDNVTVVGVDAAGSEWDEIIVSIQTSVSQIDDIIADTNDIQARLPAVLTADGNIKADTLRVGGTLQTAGDIIGDTNDIQSRLPAALTADGNIKADTLRVGGTLQTAGDIIGDTNDIQTRIPAALVSGRMDSSVGAMAANTITAASMAADASAEIADAVWDEDATGHQTQGTFGQAIGDPAADTNTIYKAVVTDATGATVGVDVVAVKAETASIQTDTDNIQTRLPAALSGDGFMKADLKSIEDELTSGNNATLHLKKLNIVNSSGDALVALSVASGSGALFSGNGTGQSGLTIESNGAGGIAANIVGDVGMSIQSFDGDALLLDSAGGKSINAPQDINVSDGDLTLAAIASAVWANATRTLTAISDSAGITTLLTRISQALTFTVSGKVDANITHVIADPVQQNGADDTNWGGAP